MAEIYNPILSTEEIPRWRILQQRPVPDPGTALVFSGEGQPLLTIKQGERGPTSGEMLWGKYNLVYKVDMTEYPLGFACNLPCATDAFDFQAQVKFSSSVRDPEMIVRRNVTDVCALLQPLIIEVMRGISRKYEVEESGSAEHEISNSVKKAIYDEGFNLYQFTVTLSLEREARERIREKKRIQEEIQLEKVRQDLEKEKAQLAIEQARQREKLELERIRQRNQFQREEEKVNLQEALEQQKLRQDFEIQKMQFETYQARQTKQLDLEFKRQREQFELESMKFKMEFYSPLLQGGNLQLLAFQLAQRPEDVQVILQALNQQKQSEREHQVKMLKMLLDVDALEGSQINEVGKGLLRQLIGLTEQSTAVLESNLINNQETQEVLPEADNIGNETKASDIPEDFRREE